jgi:hypothetical protein
MARFLLLLTNEFKLARTAILIHVVAVVQPSILFLLMSFTLVHPTFEMNVAPPVTEAGRALLEAMAQVDSPAGVDYIAPVVVDSASLGNLYQIVTVEERGGVPTAVQRYGLIDSNLVKNLRNRLTAAVLRVWDAALDGSAVAIEEHPWLPYDVPYPVYFGMALLPLATFLAGAITGGVLTAQDFEFGTALVYRLSPIPPALVVGARLVRLVLFSLLSGGVVCAVVGLRTGFWPGDFWRLGAVLVSMAVISSSVGMVLGLLLRRSIPTFVLGLSLSLGGWIFGSGFALASGFGGVYEGISRLTPNAYAVELLFPAYYGVEVGNLLRSMLFLAVFTVVLPVSLLFVYRRRMMEQGP